MGVVHNQSAEVDKSINGFIDNVIDALIIVIVVLFLFMGPASGFIIGSVLLVTVAGTLFFMHLFGIELQRVSLGAMVIALGMLVDNAIVLIEEIDGQIAEGKAPHQAILDASASRLRPVMLAACTTILGMIPLLGDVFFVNMSVTIMCGLGFATVLTLIVIPVLYSILFRVKPA